MKLQKLKRLLAFSMAVSMVTPTTAFAMETQQQVVEEQGVVETPLTDAESEQKVETPTPEVTTPEEPEKPVVPETPEEPEKPVVPETPEEPEKPVVPETPDKPSEPEVVAPDKKLLEEAILKAEAEVKLTDKYMEESIKALQTVIAEAITLRDKPDATQAEIDAMVEKVSKVMTEMKPKEEPTVPDVEQKPEEQKPEEQKPAEEKPVVTPPINTVVPMPDLSFTDDFRFWVIAKDYAFAKDDLNIVEETKDDAKVIGTLPKDGLCYVIKKCDEKEKAGWVFVESGTVRGFVKADSIVMGDEALTKVDSLKKEVEDKVNKENEELRAKITEEVAKEFKKTKKSNEVKATKKDDKKAEDTLATTDLTKEAEKPLTEEETVNQRYVAEKKEVPSFETICTFATEVVNWKDNKANEYTRATTQNVLIAKDYALVTASTLNVREGKGTDTRIVAQLPNNALVYQIADVGSEWVYVESGDVRGFVHHDWIRDDEGVDEEVAKTGEENFPKVKEMIGYADNKATHYTMTSVKSGYHTSAKRKEVVEFASKFIGNPYVWGGNDPNTGADCSGFVKYVYNAFGYKDLPRVAADQAYYGEQIPVSQAQPGDLIFYRNASGEIYHVVMYAGDGMTVEAANQTKGICNSRVFSDACWAVRILDDDVMSEQEEIVKIAEDGSYGKYLGNFKLTYYCPNSCCCGEYANGKTATGTQTVQGRTIAVDPSVIPYGSEVIIGNRVYVAEDCGGAIKGNRIDIFMNSHEDATNMGVGYADVYLKK